ncbi:MAG: hypothetical protein QM831_09415 [Kofleriaceae bacterium]
MRWWLTASILLGAASTAKAEGYSCAVQIVRAPDDVRAAVEEELAAVHCSAPLTVRIVPTDGGYYIYAQDEHNVVHERVVPDAQSAGVLIASWTADDGMIRTPVEPIAFAQPAPKKHVVDDGDDDDDDDVDTGVHAHFDRAAHKWLTLSGGAGGTNGSRGLRADIEIVHAGNFSLDTAIAYNGSDMVAADTFTTYSAHFDDLSATIGLYYTYRRAKLHVRAGVAGGIVTTQMNLTSSATGLTQNPQLATVIGEASAMVGYAISDRWAFEAGPVITLGNEQWHMDSEMETLIRAPVAITGFAGIRRAL